LSPFKKNPTSPLDPSNDEIKKLLIVVMHGKDIEAIKAIFRYSLVARYIFEKIPHVFISIIFEIDKNLNLLEFILNYGKVLQCFLEKDSNKDLIDKIHDKAIKLGKSELIELLTQKSHSVHFTALELQSNELNLKKARMSSKQVMFHNKHTTTCSTQWEYDEDDNGKIKKVKINTLDEDLSGNKGKCIKNPKLLKI